MWSPLPSRLDSISIFFSHPDHFRPYITEPFENQIKQKLYIIQVKYCLNTCTMYIYFLKYVCLNYFTFIISILLLNPLHVFCSIPITWSYHLILCGLGWNIRFLNRTWLKPRSHGQKYLGCKFWKYALLASGSIFSQFLYIWTVLYKNSTLCKICT